MCQHTHDLGEAVNLADVEELKRLHLKAKACVDQQQDLKHKQTSIILQCYTVDWQHNNFMLFVICVIMCYINVDNNVSFKIFKTLLIPPRYAPFFK